MLSAIADIYSFTYKLTPRGVENFPKNLPLRQAEKDYYVYWWIHDGKRILLVVYVDDILITRDDTKGIDSLKNLQKHIQTKALRSLKYILGIEVVRSKKGILLSKRKYILDLLLTAKM